LSGFTPNFVQNAEGLIYKNLRVRAMETALSVTIASGVATVPTAFVALKYAYVATSPVQPLDWVPPEMIYARYPVRSGAEIPRDISVAGSNFIFGPYPGNYTIEGIYYTRLTSLSDSNATNWFTTYAPDLLLFGALLQAEPFLKNDRRLATWQVMYQSAFDSVANEEKRMRTAAGSVATRLG
jgi:hypothetical protein